MRVLKGFTAVIALLALVATGCAANDAANSGEANTIRVGYFPNITHAQALVGVQNGTFQKAVGDGVTIKLSTFNAGPQEIEALLAGQIDIGYVGPSPALNGYIQSDGEALKIISGSMSGGVALVLQPELAEEFNIQGAAALRGKKIASPQQGNTQDISLRSYLADNGLAEDTQVVPMANADQLTMFTQKELDGAWSPEPWTSRLVEDGGGVIALDETSLWPDQQFATTVVIARTEFLEAHPELIKAWLTGQIEVTDWMVSHPTEAKQLVNDEIISLTTKGLSFTVLDEAWSRITPTVDPLKSSIAKFAEEANALGFLEGGQPDLSNLYDLTALNALTSKQY